MDAKESAEHAAAAAAQYKEAQTPSSKEAQATPKRDRTASLDDVDDAKPIANYRARGVCKAALGKSFLFGRRWTPGTYAVDVDRSHIVRFEDDAAGTCWEDTPTNRYAFAGDCDVKESGDTWDAVLRTFSSVIYLPKTRSPSRWRSSSRRPHDATNFGGPSTRRERTRPRRGGPEIRSISNQRTLLCLPKSRRGRRRRQTATTGVHRGRRNPKIVSPRSKLRELRATLDDDIGPAVAVLAAGLADDPDDQWRATRARASRSSTGGWTGCSSRAWMGS